MEKRSPARPWWCGPWLPGAGLLLLVFIGLGGGAAQGTTLPSIIVQDGSTVAYSNDTIVLDGALPGTFAGGIWVTNSSTLTLSHVTLTIVNATNGGILLENGGRLVIGNSTLSADGASGFTIALYGASQLTIDHGNLSSLQYPPSLDVVAIEVNEGSKLSASDSTLVAKPDARGLIEATQSEVTLVSSATKGSIAVAAGTLTMVRAVASAFGDVVAVYANTQTTLLINGSTVSVSGGGVAVRADGQAAATVESTNVTSDDIGVSVVGGDLTMEDVAIVADAFGVVADGANLTASNVGVFNAVTALWVRGSTANFTGMVLGQGILRFNQSEVGIDDAGTLRGFLFLEGEARLTLTDTTFDWANVASSLDATIIVRWRPVFAFYTDLGVAAGDNVSWTVTSQGGTTLGQGTSGLSGTARGPPLEGPRLVGGDFLAPPSYGLAYSEGGSNGSTSITAWGPGLFFAIYLQPSLPDLGFAAAGLLFEPQAPSIGQTFAVQGHLSVPPGAGITTVTARLLVDGAEAEQGTFGVVSATAFISFNLSMTPGTHLIAIEADPLGPGGRGQVAERSEFSNNWIGAWYNASRGSPALVKPDLLVTGLWFEQNPTTALDPVTGDSVPAVILVVHVNISNQGLTPAGPFRVGVAAGVNTSNAAIPGVAARSNVTSQLSFGPYLRPVTITVRAEADIDRRVDEGNESNNALSQEANVVVVVPARTGPPIWASALALGAAVTIVGIALWGGVTLWRPEKEEEEAAKAASAGAPETKESPPPAATPSAESALLAQAPAAPPPLQLPAPPPQGYAAAPPPAYPAPPQMPWAAPAYGAAYPGTGTPGTPPARCPRCGSSQVSYTLYPVRQVVCSACRSIGLF